MSSTSTPPEATLSTTRPFGGKRKLYNIVAVQYRLSPSKHDADARELQLHVGQQVIVDTARGPVIAVVTAPIHRKVVPVDSLPKILRKATETDAAQAEKNESIERDAYRFGIERIRSRKLPMKLIRAQFMQDGSKIVFYFSAEGRIDFRDLVKDLAHRFRARIEMHQIGVRDGARMLGGIGPCGRELCCSTFLDNFDPVSIRMAKDQGLTLNPKKVSGMCGRLMCCLVYEQQVYRRMRTRLPRAGQKVNTEAGTGEILDIDVINRRVTIRLDDNNRRSFPVDEVAVIDPNAIPETVDATASPSSDFIWDDTPTETRDRSRRRRSSSRSTRDSSEKPDKSRRRTSGRRRRDASAQTAAVSRTPAEADLKAAPEQPPTQAASTAATQTSPESSADASPAQPAKSQPTKNRRRRSRRSRKSGTAPSTEQSTTASTPQSEKTADKKSDNKADKKTGRARRRKSGGSRRSASDNAKKRAAGKDVPKKEAQKTDAPKKDAQKE